MHKFAITRWRKEWTKLLNEFDNLKTLDDAKRLSRRLAVWQEAAKGGHLSKRYQEDFATLWDRYERLARSKGFRVSVDKPELTTNLISGFFKPEKNVITLQKKNPITLMHEIYEGISAQQLQSQWGRQPISKRLRTAWRLLSEYKVPFWKRIPFTALLTRPSVMTGFRFGGMYGEPFSHFRGVLRKERDFLKFMLLHPDPKVQESVRSLLVPRNLYHRINEISYSPGEKAFLSSPPIRKTMKSLVTTEWGLAKTLPKNTLLVRLFGVRSMEPGSVRLGEPHPITRPERTFLKAIKNTRLFSNAKPLARNAFLFDYSRERGRLWHRIMGPKFSINLRKDLRQPRTKFSLNLTRNRETAF